ncbi:MAG: hypothetical protein BECKG1743E_GA0114224_109901, partial [Candidatus Kentron sp. G]
DVKCLGFLYLYVGRYPRNNASRNTKEKRVSVGWRLCLRPTRYVKRS